MGTCARAPAVTRCLPRDCHDVFGTAHALQEEVESNIFSGAHQGMPELGTSARGTALRSMASCDSTAAAPRQAGETGAGRRHPHPAPPRERCERRRAWKARAMGGRAQARRSRVVASSSTVAVSACSLAPWYRLTFHTSACFLGSYLALPARPAHTS